MDAPGIQALLGDEEAGALGAERYQNDLFIESLTLGPGTYWLGLNEGTNFHYDFIYWETANPDGTSYSYYSQGGTNNWQYNSDGTYAFELLDNTSSVPEPASMTLLATGLIGVFGVTRPRWKANSAA